MSAPVPLRIACGQFTATANPLQNLAACTRLIALAVSAGATMLFLPEASDYIASSPAQGRTLLGSPEAATFLRGLCSLAQTHALAINVGVHTRAAAPPTHAHNTSLYIDATGAVTQRYHKLHLFSIAHGGSATVLSEAATTAAGAALTPAFATPAGALGLQVCYDVRFPRAAAALAPAAHVLAYPSAFTAVTGRAHWELLLRARAVEGQCWVVAAAQVGLHSEDTGRRSWGQAMVVDPWGVVRGRCGSLDEDGGEEVCVVDVDHEMTARVRREMDLVGARRGDVYGDFKVE
ncbi:putative nitrilase [Geopyxis carbonaria]|nr:putative nitrilase [Geopyxis carbonaria]